MESKANVICNEVDFHGFALLFESLLCLKPYEEGHIVSEPY